MDTKRDILAIDDLSPDELRDIIKWAISAKQDEGLFEEFMPLQGMTIGSIYEKPSTRTRVSFEVGIDKLGGNPLTLLKGDIQLGKSESIEDTAAVLSRYLGAITYRCFGHADVESLANGHARFIDSSLCSERVLLFIPKQTEGHSYSYPNKQKDTLIHTQTNRRILLFIRKQTDGHSYSKPI